jgi:hypothetical protein
VFGAIRPGQGLGDLGLEGATALVSELGQLVRVADTAENGLEDLTTGDAGEFADHHRPFQIEPRP